MSISIAQSRQQLSSLIIAAQVSPQTITNRNKPVAVLVSAEYYKQVEVATAKADSSFYNQLMKLRSSCGLLDDEGIPGADQPRSKSWSRANPFTDAS